MKRDGKAGKEGESMKMQEQAETARKTEPLQQEEAKPKKKKRKSPAVPWKKPKDMPKRPLSAYNLFFKAERERLISAGPKGKTASEEESSGGIAGKSGRGSPDRKHSKTSGLGFANLAKTIAAKWKTLDPEERAPFEQRAAVDKKRYDEAVAEWREKQAKKQKAETLASISEVARPSSPHAGLSVTSHPSVEIAGFENPYPPEWFDMSPGAAVGTAAQQPGLQSQQLGRGAHVPPFINTITDDSSRTWELSPEAGEDSALYAQRTSLDRSAIQSLRELGLPMQREPAPAPVAQYTTGFPSETAAGAFAASRPEPLPTAHEFARALPHPPRQMLTPPSLQLRRAAAADLFSQYTTTESELSNLATMEGLRVPRAASLPAASMRSQPMQPPSRSSREGGELEHTAPSSREGPPVSRVARSASLPPLPAPFQFERSFLPGEGQVHDSYLHHDLEDIGHVRSLEELADDLRQQQADMQGQPSIQETSLQALGQRLDDDTIDFLTGLSFSKDSQHDDSQQDHSQQDHSQQD